MALCPLAPINGQLRRRPEKSENYTRTVVVGAYRTYKALLPIYPSRDSPVDPLESTTVIVHVAFLVLVCAVFYYFAELVNEYLHLPSATAANFWFLLPPSILEQARLQHRYPRIAPFIVLFVAILVFLLSGFTTKIPSNGLTILKVFLDTFYAVVIAMMSVPILSMLILTAVTVLLAAATVSFNLVLIKPSAFILSRIKSERRIKVATVLLIILGFQFDLLAS
jgi:hypothetical protein